LPTGWLPLTEVHFRFVNLFSQEKTFSQNRFELRLIESANRYFHLFPPEVPRVFPTAGALSYPGGGGSWAHCAHSKRKFKNTMVYIFCFPIFSIFNSNKKEASLIGSRALYYNEKERKNPLLWRQYYGY